MKRFSRWFLVLFTLVAMMSCSCQGMAPYPQQFLVQDQNSNYYAVEVERLNQSTVVLFGVNEDANKYSMVCSGVVLNDGLILTARHCLKAAVPELEMIEEFLGMDPPYKMAIGRTFYFTNYENSEKTFKLDDPDNKPYAALVVDVDMENDLALLQPLQSFNHQSVTIREFGMFWVGQPVVTVGHPGGLIYSYIPGTISGMRDMESEFEKELDLQVSIPIYGGSSGGGLFDSQGYLIGICSKYTIKIPNVGFFVNGKAIWNFVSNYRSVPHMSIP